MTEKFLKEYLMVLKSYEIQISKSINKVLFQSSQAHLLYIVYECIICYNGRTE